MRDSVTVEWFGDDGVIALVRGQDGCVVVIGGVCSDVETHQVPRLHRQRGLAFLIQVQYENFLIDYTCYMRYVDLRITSSSDIDTDEPRGCGGSGVTAIQSFEKNSILR